MLPDFPALPMTGGGSFLPQNLIGQWTVLYFYPKDATPGCTTEGQAFRDNYSTFRALDAVVYGVSRDGLPAHERFKEKQGFPFELVSDVDEVLCKAFDVIKEKNMYGKKVMGVERSTFLFNPAGELLQTWRKVKVAGHVDAVLDALRQARG